MNSQDRTPAKSDSSLSPQDGASERWKRKLAELALETQEAKASLVEDVARRRAFQFLDTETGERPEDHGDLFLKAIDAYLDGRFFLWKLSLYYEVSPELSLVVYGLRQEWIKQYDLRTVPELILLDQAMLAYFNIARLHKDMAGMVSLIESQLFYADPPWIKIKEQRRLNNEFDGFVAEDAIKQLQERLVPLMERFNQMFLRNLKALRELKAHPININIGQAEQVNVAQQQVNVKEGSAAEG